MIGSLAFAAGSPASADPCLAERKDRSDESRPLHTYPELYEAINRKNRALALCLIGYGADVDEPGYNDWTPLSRAAQFGMLDVVQALLAAGADPGKADTFEKVPFDYATEFYEKYSSGDYTKGSLGDDPERRISEYLEIVKLLSQK